MLWPLRSHKARLYGNYEENIPKVSMLLLIWSTELWQPWSWTILAKKVVIQHPTNKTFLVTLSATARFLILEMKLAVPLHSAILNHGFAILAYQHFWFFKKLRKRMAIQYNKNMAIQYNITRYNFEIKTNLKRLYKMISAVCSKRMIRNKYQTGPLITSLHPPNICTTLMSSTFHIIQSGIYSDIFCHKTYNINNRNCQFEVRSVYMYQKQMFTTTKVII